MKHYLGLLLALIYVSNVFATSTTLNLVVGYKTVYFAGKWRQAIAVNNQIPAPTLHFKQGDHVTINVYNRLNEETAIHWHGILVPWQMDGVLGVSQRGIQPGHVFHYRFTLQQSGTYWYHAHAGLQEQQGLYGAFLIDPLSPLPYHYTKDFVIVLSDWSNTYPNQILANLKKDGDYYSPNFPLQPSFIKFIHDYRHAAFNERQMILNNYKMMQQMRMSIYDLSDVAYDAFLLNGHSKEHPWTALVKKNDIVRLRFIGAAGDTIYHVKIPHSMMQIVHVQGNDVKPYAVNDFTIAPGETYDVLVTITHDKPTIIYAEARDKVGAAYGALVTSTKDMIDYADIKPFPEPLPVTQEMMMNSMASNMNPAMPAMRQKKIKVNPHLSHKNMYKNMRMNMPMNKSMPDMQMDPPADEKLNIKPKSMAMSQASMSNHQAVGMMTMPTEPSIVGDHILKSPVTPAVTIGTKYQNITAAVKTNDPDQQIDGIIKMDLFGYMGRFIWFINGLPEYLAKPIQLEPGKRYRLIFTNTSMMHHPMHIHGHWFILRNGHGAYDPLLHTLDIPPGATVTADLDTEASGQWFFHCHLLYHMVSGMSRVVQYSSLIEIIQGHAAPANKIQQTAYVNRPIVRVDELRPIDLALVRHPMAHPMGFYFANFLEAGVDPFDNVQRITFKGLYGQDYHKLELFMNDAEINKSKIDNADIDIFYWHLLDQFWAIKGGVNYFYRPATKPYWQPGVGIEGLMPYFIDTNLRSYFYSGSAKLDIELSRDTQLSNNFFLRLAIRSIFASKTISQAAIGSGLNQMRYMVRPYYRLLPGLSLFAEYENERDYGAYQTILRQENEVTNLATLTFGLSFLF